MLDCLGGMTNQASCRIIANCDNVLDGRSRAGLGLPCGIVASVTRVFMQPQDSRPGVSELTVTVVAVVALGLVDTGPHCHGVRMGVIAEVAGMAVIALSRGCLG